MPLSRRVARFNRRVTNRIARRVATWAPTLGIVQHRGRRSGRTYETPVNVFRDGDRYVFALTYGEGDWVRNVLDAGGCEIRTHRRSIRLADPQRVDDASRRLVPIPFRWVLGLLRVHEFLVMRAATRG